MTFRRLGTYFLWGHGKVVEFRLGRLIGTKETWQPVAEVGLPRPDHTQRYSSPSDFQCYEHDGVVHRLTNEANSAESGRRQRLQRGTSSLING
jgi:hypothetical protein